MSLPIAAATSSPQAESLDEPLAEPLAGPLAEPRGPVPHVPSWLAVLAAVGPAIMAAFALSWDRPGIGWPLTAVATITAAGLVVRKGARRGTRGRLWFRNGMATAGWTAAAVMLLAVGAVRAAGWLFVLCALAAGFIGCVALARRWSVPGMLLAPVRTAHAVPAAFKWFWQAQTAAHTHDRRSLIRALAASLITLTLLLVFGFLFASADAAFAQLLTEIAPPADGPTLIRWAGSAALALTATTAGTYLALTGRNDTAEIGRRWLVRRLEWAVPVGGLVVLFAAFVAVQARFLFGGGEHVLATAGLTYAEYARSGFWQLLAITGLTLAVVSVAAQIAPRTTLADRVLQRTLLGLLSSLALVIVASALSRMAAYEQAYGFTRLRLLVTAAELWLGLLFLLILIAGLRLQGKWVPQAALATAVATLLGLAALNPDAFIAERNIARFATTKQIDIDYLTTLSPDATPALRTLPEPYRSCALATIKELNRDSSDSWLQWNLGRATARAGQHGQTPPAVVACYPRRTFMHRLSPDQ
jgi:hypothetical protein